jgi:hypothetical protein
MKKELSKLLREYFFVHVKLKKTPENLTKILVKGSGIKMLENGSRKKYSERFLEEANACTIEEIFSDIVFKTYTNKEVYFLLKIENDEKVIEYFILRHFKSLKTDFYFGINIFPKEEFEKDKAMKESLFFFKKK